MKYLFVVFFIAVFFLALAGCGQIDRDFAKWSGRGTKTCMEGVVYYQFTSGASVAYNTDGTIKKCEE